MFSTVLEKKEKKAKFTDDGFLKPSNPLGYVFFNYFIWV